MKMSAFSINDHVRFQLMGPEGRINGSGRIAKILPVGKSFWLHVVQDDGSTRMIYEATTKLELMELEAA
jgi:hypothetical protein